MANLKDETLKAIKESGNTIEAIEYCHIYNTNRYGDNEENHCFGDFNSDNLNFRYDDGYGGQEISGFIVFKDGTWLDRREYDGSEWWEHQIKPTL